MVASGRDLDLEVREVAGEGLTREEFVEGIRGAPFKVALTPADFGALFEKVDASGDGRVSYDEFRRFVSLDDIELDELTRDVAQQLLALFAEGYELEDLFDPEFYFGEPLPGVVQDERRGEQGAGASAWGTQRRGGGSARGAAARPAPRRLAGGLKRSGGGQSGAEFASGADGADRNDERVPRPYGSPSSSPSLPSRPAAAGSGSGSGSPAITGYVTESQFRGGIHGPLLCFQLTPEDLDGLCARMRFKDHGYVYLQQLRHLVDGIEKEEEAVLDAVVRLRKALVERGLREHAAPAASSSSRGEAPIDHEAFFLAVLGRCRRAMGMRFDEEETGRALRAEAANSARSNSAVSSKHQMSRGEMS